MQARRLRRIRFCIALWGSRSRKGEERMIKIMLKAAVAAAVLIGSAAAAAEPIRTAAATAALSMILIILSSPFLDRDPQSAMQNLMRRNRRACIFEFHRSSKALNRITPLRAGGIFPYRGQLRRNPAKLGAIQPDPRQPNRGRSRAALRRRPPHRPPNQRD